MTTFSKGFIKTSDVHLVELSRAAHVEYWLVLGDSFEHHLATEVLHLENKLILLCHIIYENKTYKVNNLLY